MAESCYKKGFSDWLGATDAQIIGLQEVRALPEQLTDGSENRRVGPLIFHRRSAKGDTVVSPFTPVRV